MDNLRAGIQAGWGEQWETLANAINSYYGGGIDSTQYQRVVNMLNSGNYTMEEMESIIGNIPEFKRTYNASGELINVSYKVSSNSPTTSAGSIAQEINSNVENATATQFSSVQTITKNAQTGKVSISDIITKYNGGVPLTAKAVAIDTLSAIGAVSTGIALGKTIDQSLYNANPDFWDSHGMSALNPQTWASITEGQSTWNATLVNLLLGIDPTTNNPQVYMDENAFAYMVGYMMSQGVYDESDYEVVDGDSWAKEQSWFENIDLPIPCTNNPTPFAKTIDDIASFEASSPGRVFTYIDDNRVNAYMATESSSANLVVYNTVSGTTTRLPASGTQHVINGHTFYMYGYSGAENVTTSMIPIYENLNGSYIPYCGYLLLYGDIEGFEIPGITDQSGATQFDTTGLNDPSDIAAILAALMLQFPDLWDNRIEFSPDGNTIKKYVPVGFPTGGTGDQASTEGASQLDLVPDITGDGDNATDSLIKTLIEAIQGLSPSTGMDSDTGTPVTPADPTANPSGTGSTPVVVPPSGGASALFAIYNPSQAELNAFGAWLWSNNFVDQLLKLFNDPMQAIIGLHKVFVTPSVSGSGPIYVGYLQSSATANYVSQQYTEIDCGSVNISEYFANAFDYSPYTRIFVYLPFIGFQELNVSDVMRGTVNIKYTVDVLTGACLAKIYVTRDANKNLLYTFAGNCAVQYPISSGSYIGIVTGELALGAGIAAGILSGNVIPAVMGAAAGIGQAHTNVKHSGNIGSNAGAMGPKKPYIVIERPQPAMPNNGEILEGVGQNEVVTIGSLKGFVKVKKCDLNGIPASSDELNEIRMLLEDGFYMN